MSPLFHHAFAERMKDAFWEITSIQYNSHKVQLKRDFSRTRTLVPAWNSSGGKWKLSELDSFYIFKELPAE